MAKVIRPGKVVIILNGRHAGKKAIIVKANEEGTANRRHGHALVVGIDRAPLSVTSDMGEKKISQRSRVKPFIKVVNLNHVMLTRYAVDNLDFKAALSAEDTQDPTKKKEINSSLRKLLEERYASGMNRWFFQKLRF